MVARINHGSNLYGALSYNQEKVDEGLGKVLATNMVMEPTDGRFSVAACMQDFERFMPSHITTSKPVIHISLNPHPDDKLTDAQLADIGREYMERLGYGGQPYIVFKHEDIDRQHIHIVGSRVRTDGTPVPDRFENGRSTKIIERMERDYGLVQAKGRGTSEVWQLSPIDTEAGNLKKQVANVVKPLAAMYRFGSLGEYRALLSLYNIGVEEVKGERMGKPYEGLVYSVLDKGGNRIGTPLKSSLFGKSVGVEGLKNHFEKSREAAKTDGSVNSTRSVVVASLTDSRDENGFRTALQNKDIDLVLRRNTEGRLYGVTFIDHNSRTVLNGSALGKEFSANKLAERWADNSLREDLQPLTPNIPKSSVDFGQQAIRDNDSTQPKEKGHTSDEGSLGSLFSVLTPETHSDNQSVPEPRKKKKRRYGRQV